MLSINTNLSSLIAQNSLKNSTLSLNTAVERMSTGYKINGAKDNAANYSISTNMTTQLSAYQVVEDNVAGGLDLLSTANDALSLIGDKLSRLRALAEQSANGTYSRQSLKSINREANAIVDEINRIYNTTEYNGINLFRDETSPISRISTFSLDEGRSAGSSNKFVNDIDRIDTTSLTALSGVSSITRGASYAINEVDDLKKLSELVNAGADTTGTTFILGKDIDFSGVDDWVPIAWTDEILADSEMSKGFKGTLDGNGYSINNMNADLSTATHIDTTYMYGLFGVICGGTVKNLGFNNFSFDGSGADSTDTRALTLAWILKGGTIDNCFAQNVSVNNTAYSGLIGTAFNSSVKNTYVNGFNANHNAYYTAGLISYYAENSDITNCCVNLGSVTDCFAVGIVPCASNVNFTDISVFTAHPEQIHGMITYEMEGNNTANGTCNLNQEEYDYILDVGGWAYLTGEVTGSLDDNVTATNITTFNDYSNNFKTPTGSSGVPGSGEEGGEGGGSGGHNSFAPESITFQVGTNSNRESQIRLKTSFKLPGINSLRQIGLNTAFDFLSNIDNLTDTISAKQTEYGAAQNRMESALDEISTRYENLTSSRSTLRDADMSEVSSQYIRQQILQQASATLLATANQNPSIALQLL